MPESGGQSVLPPTIDKDCAPVEPLDLSVGIRDLQRDRNGSIAAVAPEPAMVAGERRRQIASVRFDSAALFIADIFTTIVAVGGGRS